MGEVIDLGRTTVSKEMIITFAREFDPFPFHLDEAAAKDPLVKKVHSSFMGFKAIADRWAGVSEAVYHAQIRGQI